MKAFVVTLILAGVGSACSSSRTIIVDGNRPVPRVVEGERIQMGQGEQLRIVVRDSVWGNRWVASYTDSALPAIERAAVFGSTASIARLASWLRPSVSGGQHDLTARELEDHETFNDFRLIGGAGSARAHAPLRRRAEALIDQARQEHARAWMNAEDFQADITQLNEALPVLPAAFDTAFHRAVRELAASPERLQATNRLTGVASGGPWLQPDELDGIISRTLRYGAMLSFVTSRYPSVPEPDLAFTGILKELRRQRDEGREAVARRDVLLAAAVEPIAQAGLRLEGSWPTPSFQTTVGGYEIAPLLRLGAVEDLERVGRDLEALGKEAPRIIAALNQLPQWTRGPDSTVIDERSFPGGRQLLYTIQQYPRYPRYQLPAESGASTATAQADKGPSTTARVEVFPRYRFHVGAGLVRSPLDLNEFSTTADTVDGVAGVRLRQTVGSSSQMFPSLLVSYTLLPWEGKSYDARENTPGIGVQAGVSLRDPSENAFFGLATEPLPGIHLGWGYHFGYVQRTPYQPGAFVPDDAGAAVFKEWAGSWNAWSLGIDVKTFFDTIGALFK